MALNKEVKENSMVNEFKLHPQDTGSEYVQVAALTARIKELTEHLKLNKKDFSAKKGLLHMISQRSSFLRYLKGKNQEKYRDLIKRLGLKS